MFVVAIPLGLFGFFSVDAKYKMVQVPAVTGTATRDVPQGDCVVKSPFLLGSQSFGSGQTLNNAVCRQAFRTLPNPGRHLEATLAAEEYETVVEQSKRVEQRQWGSEIFSRLVSFLVAGLLGVVLVVAANFVYLNRSRLASATSSGLQATREAATRMRATTNQMTGGAGTSQVTGSGLAAPQQASPIETYAAPAPKNNFDLHFNRFVTPTIVKILYVLLSAFIFIGGIIIAVGFAFDLGPDSGRSYFVGLLISVPLALVGMALSWLLVRLICESAIVRFRMAEDIRRIRNR